MKKHCYQFFLLLSCCFLFACQTDVKSTPAPTAAPKPGSVATPSDISRPDAMVNNFQRMQGEWRQADDPEKEIQVFGRKFVEIVNRKDRSEVANGFKVVKDCEGAVDVDGIFFMVGNRCFKILNISIEEMEVEEMEQQRVVKYLRI